MLYKKIHLVGLAIYATLSRTTFGAEYVAFANKSPDGCSDAGPTDTCTFHCDKKQWGQDFDCGDVDICNISCDQKLCFEVSNITATNTNQFNVDAGTGQQCYLQTTFHLPASGSANFNADNNSDDPYQSITINAGANTQDIYINCAGGDAKSQCTSMTVNAQTAQTLHINVENAKLLGTANDMVNIYCPQNTLHGGVDGAPCYINAWPQSQLDNVNVHTLLGIPYDLWFNVDDEKNFKNIIVTCAEHDSNAAVAGKDIMKLTNDCYNTRAPTTAAPTPPTLHPTTSPTPQPTKATSKPTGHPTRTPTISPTLQPTSTPTQNPSTNPSIHPTISPSKNPTTSYPTRPPSVSPSRNPSIPPTLHPTRTPTVSPTRIPSISPTKFPTGTPTVSPSRIPSISPTTFPTNSPSAPPTAVPTEATHSPTKSPTEAEQEVREPETTTSTTEFEDDLLGGSHAENDTDSTLFLIFVFVGAFLLAILGALVCCYFCFAKRQKRSQDLMSMMGSGNQKPQKTENDVRRNAQRTDVMLIQPMPVIVPVVMAVPTPGYIHGQNDVVALAESHEGNRGEEGDGKVHDDVDDSDDDLVNELNATAGGPLNIDEFEVNTDEDDGEDGDEILNEVNTTAGGEVQ
eukprot:545730_1